MSHARFNCENCDDGHHEECYALRGVKECRCYDEMPATHQDGYRRAHVSYDGPVEQPPPAAVKDAPFVQDLVMKDLDARKQHGIDTYGTALQAGNGRDMLLDAYEEALDLTIYLRGVMEEMKAQKQPAIDVNTNEKAMMHTCGYLKWIDELYYDPWYCNKCDDENSEDAWAQLYK